MLTYNLSFKKVMSSCSIEPEWQRNSNLWPTRVVNQYLDDILDGNPMAPILVFKDKELKKKVVIDGKQRISNLLTYLKHPDATPEEKATIKEYEFAVVEYPYAYFEKESTGKLDIQKVVDFFHKTNSLSMKLNAQETRRALDIKKPYVRFVKDARNSGTFNKFLDLFAISEDDIDRMQLRFLDEEFILKTMGYHYIEDFNRSPYTAKLIESSVAPKSRKVLKADFEKVFGSFLELYANGGLGEVRFVTKYKGVMPLIIGIITQYDRKDLKRYRKEIVSFLDDFWVLSSQEIALKHRMNFNSGSGFYRAICDLILAKMDEL